MAITDTHRRMVCLLALMLAGARGPMLQAQDAASAESVVRAYRAARRATMQERGTPADVAAAVAFLSDSVVYEHAAAGARLVGREVLAEGMRGFLGRTRNARIKVRREIATPFAVAAEEEVTFEMQRDGRWERQSRRQLSVYEVRDGRITRLIEYWLPR